MNKGDIVVGRINKITDKGMFVTLSRSNFGFMPKNQASDFYDNDGQCIYEKGQTVEVVIFDVTDRGVILASKSYCEKLLAKTKEKNFDVNIIKRNLKLKDNHFIGRFTLNSDGSCTIRDIRRTDFSSLILPNKKRQNPISFHPASPAKIKDGQYYEFEWTLKAVRDNYDYIFGVEQRFTFKQISAKQIVEKLHNAILDYPAGAGNKIENMLQTLSKDLTASGKEVFIYELLQNANDYPISYGASVDVEFYILNNYLIFRHTGAEFTPSNVAALCDINDKDKVDNKNAIGYKGIGFKTVFMDNNYVYLKTGDFSFRFDESFTKDMVGTPFQILPIYTDFRKCDNEIQSTFSNDNFRVQFALRPRSLETLRNSSQNYVEMFTKVFTNERVILFIPNISSVKIFFSNHSEPDIYLDKISEEWIVNEYKEQIEETLRKEINQVIENQEESGVYKIPPKYYDFEDTIVSFACHQNDGIIEPIEDANIYCYLPTKADFGFKFLMNVDMIPTGPRDDIEDIKLNHEIARIAGRQFFYWIKDLISSNKYNYDSIFNLIPDFDECKKIRKYKAFIEEFQEEFQSLIKSEPFIPCIDTVGNETLTTVDDIINDLTDLSTAGIMSDTEFIKLSDTGCEYLPIMEVRDSRAFHDFVYRYSPREYDLDFEKLLEVCDSSDFQEWLSKHVNNINFIKFLLEKKQLDDFSEKSIFIEYEEDLFKAQDLYYDFDAHFRHLEFFRTKIPHLHPDIKTKLMGIEGWGEFAEEHFKDFDVDEMFETYIFSNAEQQDSLNKLENLNNSIDFYRYVAEHNADIQQYLDDLPYYDEDGNIKYGFDGIVYFYSDSSQRLSKEIWIPEDTITILSHQYIDTPNDVNSTKEKFIELGVKQFDICEFINEKIISESDFKNNVNNLIEEDFEANKAFVLYMFNNRELFKSKDNQLSEYVLLCNDIENDESYLCADSSYVRYFRDIQIDGNHRYEDNIFEWLNHDMMYSLNPAYFDIVITDQRKNLESFLRQSFGIFTFTDKSFLKDVVLKRKDDIYKNLFDNENLKSFIDYLERDTQIIFDGSLSENDFKNLPLLHYDGTISNERQYHIYLYDKVAQEMKDSSWCTDDFILLNDYYTKHLPDKAFKLLGIDKFNLFEALQAIINSNDFDIDGKTPNMDFWRWVKAHQKEIDDLTILSDCYIYDRNEETNNCASDLYIPDVYQTNGIESLLLKFLKEDVTFISDDFLEVDTETEKKEWFNLFKKLGAKYDLSNMLNDVIKSLHELDEVILDDVIAMLAKSQKDIISRWDEYKNDLQTLKVKTRSGQYLTLDEVVIVITDLQKEDTEPFKYISIENEIDPNILKDNENIILKIAESFSDTTIIKTRIEWAQLKINEYIEVIQNNDDIRDKIHVMFIRDLASFCESYIDKIDSNSLNKIAFLSKDSNEYFESDELTLGSAYSPACDFEKYGVNLNYLSDEYITENNKDIIKKFFRDIIGIHHRFEKEDIAYMNNRVFAVYVWNIIFKRIEDEFEQWIEEGEFNTYECIPTGKNVCKPKDIYSPTIKEYAQHCPSCQSKLVAKEVDDKLQERREVFCQLPFENNLSSSDCLYYLLHVTEKNDDEKSHREQILTWLLQNNDLSAEEIMSYRADERALWRNGKGEMTHISKLYALSKSAIQIRDVFSGNEHIIRTWSFPDNKDDFKRVCEILKLKILDNDNFETIPTPDDDEQTNEMLNTISPKLPILAAIKSPKRMRENYNKYWETIKSYSFYSCDKIELAYNELIGEAGRIYHDDTNQKLYYVGEWNGRRTYTKFCNIIKQILNLDISNEVIEDVFELSVDECIEKYCSSMRYEDDFIDLMKEMNANIQKKEDITPMQSENFYTESEDAIATDEDPQSEEDNKGGEITSNPEHQEYESVDLNDSLRKDTKEEPENQYPWETLLIEDGDDDIPINDTAQLHLPNQSANVICRKHKVLIGDEEHEVVCEHYRNGTWVHEYYRSDGTFVSGHWRSDAVVGEHLRTKPEATHGDGQSAQGKPNSERQIPKEETEQQQGTQKAGNQESTNTETKTRSIHRDPLTTTRNTADGLTFVDNDDIDEGYPYSGNQETTPLSEYEPKPNKTSPTTWKNKEVNQVELGTKDISDEELEKINSFIGGGKTLEEIIDEHLLVRYRLYNALKNKYGEKLKLSEKEFIQSKSSEIETDGTYIYARSAKGGILFISAFLWNKLLNKEGRICMYYGNRAYDFELIDNVDQLIKYVGKYNIIVQIKGENKIQTINSILKGDKLPQDNSVHVLIRIKSNERYNNLFASTFRNNDNNGVDF